MTTKTFVNFNTPAMDADWANDVDLLTYEIFTTLSTTVPVVAGAWSFSNTTASTSGSTGSINTAGGIGAVKDIVTDATFKPLGDTAAGDLAAIGYTSTEGLILTGQGSTNDVTIKNDADVTVLSILTGTTNIVTGGNILSDTDSTDDLGTTSARWANVYTDAIGDTGQSLEVKASDLKISDGVFFVKEQAEADADQAGFGQFWVDTATPNIPMFTDDAGTDHKLNTDITIGTEDTTTGGTSIVQGSIPSGAKKITIMLEGLSTSGTSDIIVRLGDAGGIETSGYTSVAQSGASKNSITSGFVLNFATAAASVYTGSITLFLKDVANFTWIANGIVGIAADTTAYSQGAKSLSAELTQISVTTVGGSETFDANAGINIQYE